MLLRRYIGKRLADYYRQPEHSVVGRTSSEIDLKGLFGEWHWKRVYKRLYEEQEGQGLTPVELFRPHYSAVFAEFCVSEAQKHDQEIEIVELGGGRGTNAMCILSHLERHHPSVYDRLQKYTIVDSSPSLHALQQETLVSKSELDSSKLDFQLRDLTDVAESRLVQFTLVGVCILYFIPGVCLGGIHFIFLTSH